MKLWGSLSLAGVGGIIICLLFGLAQGRVGTYSADRTVIMLGVVAASVMAVFTVLCLIAHNLFEKNDKQE